MYNYILLVFSGDQLFSVYLTYVTRVTSILECGKL